ncbi:MAG: VWA domain-containing protein [Nitrospinota bacterium]|nr:VWA domain-containing protein [Nitrospinota bacterium]
MRFAQPEWLYLAMAAPLILGLAAWRGIIATRNAMELFLSPDDARRLVDTGLARRKLVRAAMLILAAVLTMSAMARPQFGIKPMEVKRAGVDVMLLVDTSTSMAATDVKPSRMERARNELTRLVEALEGNRIGIIAFAGESFMECPLTLDSGTVRLFLDTIETGIIPTPGTSIGAAVEDAVAALTRGGTVKSKVIILVTDGEDLAGEVDRAATAAKKAGVKIFSVGIGSVSGAPIPEVDDMGQVAGYKKDSSGAPLLTRLDTAALSLLSGSTGGTSISSQGERLDLSSLIDEIRKQEKTDIGSFEFSEYVERYPPLAALALVLLVGEYLLSSWRGREKSATA